MHPILQNRKVLAIFLAGWMILSGLLGALPAWTGDLDWKDSLVLFLPLGIIHAFMSLGSWYMVRVFPLDRTGWLRLSAILAWSTLLTCGVWGFLGRSWVMLISQIPGWAGISGRFHKILPFFFGIGVLLYVLAMALHYLFLFFENTQAAEQRALASRMLARESELKALKAQIHPHFLFNSLNSISALTSSDPSASRRMCLLLAEFLRKSLEGAGQQTVPLAEELNLVEKYLAIEKVRFGERLRYELVVSPEALEVPILPLLLQPLVENAVNHGISRRLEGGTIRVTVAKRGQAVWVEMENPCDPDGPVPGKSGFGLSLVQRRLQEYYGDQGRLLVERHPNSFRVRVMFPVGSAEA